MRARAWVVGLTTAGLIPMLISVAFILHPAAQHFLKYYSLAILAFLGGAWWSVSLMNQTAWRSTRLAVLIASNLVVLIAVVLAAWVSSSAFVYVGYSLLFVALWLGEVRLAPFQPQPRYYRTLRKRVSLAASALHVAAAALLWTANVEL